VSTLAREKINDVVPRDAEQPAAKSAFGRVGVPTVDGGRHGPEDVLAQITGVSVLQTLAAGDAVQERLVHVDEFGPGGLVVEVPQSQDEAASSIRLHA
jgi:hypothetical protein